MVEILPKLGHSFGSRGQSLWNVSVWLVEWLVVDSQWLVCFADSDFLNVWQHCKKFRERSFLMRHGFVFSIVTQWRHGRMAISAISFFLDLLHLKACNDHVYGTFIIFLAQKGDGVACGVFVSHSFFYTRSVNVELNLEAGNYIILVSKYSFSICFLFFLSDLCVVV